MCCECRAKYGGLRRPLPHIHSIPHQVLKLQASSTHTAYNLSVSMESDADTSNPQSLVLNNPDLLEYILHHLSNHIKSRHHRYPHSPRLTRRHLLFAGLTSKAFWEPAVALLWHDMESIWPLFQVLPMLRKRKDGNHVSVLRCYVCGIKYIYISQVLTGAVHEQHIQRLLFYASHIRHLRYQKPGEHPIFGGQIPHIFDTINKLGAFSLLCSLYVIEEVLEGPFPEPILAPNLETFYYSRLRTSRSESVAANFIQAAIPQAQHVSYLLMAGTFTATTFGTLPPFPNLKQLKLVLSGSSRFPMTSMPRCALSMKSLKTLVLGLPLSTDVFTSRGIPPPPSVFGSLTDIYIEGTSKDAKTILDGVRTPSLVHLNLSVWIITPQTRIVKDEVAAIIQGFIRNNRQDAKDKLRFLYISVRCPSPSDCSFHLDSLNLKCFEHLGALHLHAPFRISMSEFEHSLCTQPHWSNLRRMELFDISADNQLSIMVLALIAKSCPKLVQLEIAISNPDRSEVGDATHPGTLGHPHNLEGLTFYRLPDDDSGWGHTPQSATMLSSFLDTLFPNLNVLRYCTPVAPDLSESQGIWWKCVHDIWKSCQSNRRDGLVSDNLRS